MLPVQVPRGEVELDDWQREAIEYLARGERVPDELLEGKDEFCALYMRCLEEMLAEGYFDEELAEELAEDEED